MRNKISIAIVGNCQARPLAEVIQSLVPSVNIVGIAIVHLLSDSDESSYAPIFKSADVILSQRVTDNYLCRFVRSADLRDKYPDRVLTWPNLYYAGYNPELTYLRNREGKPLRGPMGEYHSRTIFDAWRRGLSTVEALRLHNDDDYNREVYGGIPSKSLEELRRRETETDVRIVDWIAERICRQRLFFTFNHPARVLIRELGVRLIRAVGHEVAYLDEPIKAKCEPLGQLGCPVNPWIAKTYGCSFDDPNIFRGNEVVVTEGNDVITGKHRNYDAGQIVDVFYHIYDVCRNDV